MEINTLSLFERATLANQYKILAFVDPANAESHNADVRALEAGFVGEYKRILEHFSPEVSGELCTEAHKILSMYRIIRPSVEALSDEERNQLDLNRIRFDGFDANHDSHYHLATFWVEERGLYKELKGVELNSGNYASIQRYRAMIPVFYEVYSVGKQRLSYGDLQRLIESV